jgi:hypothetical protein
MKELTQMPVWLAAVTVLVANLPFGYWRANVRKFSVQWALAIHIPVVLAITIRIVGGIPFEPTTLAIMVAAFFFGQTAGKSVRGALATILPVQLTSCLPLDLIRAIMG